MIERVRADTLELASCVADCKCQQVHVIMVLDGDRSEADIHIEMALTPDEARKMARQLFQRADLADAQDAKVSGRLS